MEGISEMQMDLIERIERRGMPSSLIISNIWEFLNEKDDNEPLLPDWKEIWSKYRRIAVINEYAPEEIIENIDEIFNSITQIDEEIMQIRMNENTKITFLLGAGASAPSNIPTVYGLLPELWKRARKIGRDDLDKLADWCDKLGITSIEDLLTAAYISEFAAKNPDINYLLEYFLFSEKRALGRNYGAKRPIRTSKTDVSSISFLQDTLQTLFGLLTSTMISASPNGAHQSIVKFIKKHEKTSIITTNYDGCMDEALLDNNICFSGIKECEGPKIELIKMHGSINWSYCESCQDVREFDLREVKKIYNDGILSYPVQGICKNCGGLSRPLLVPPMSFKFLNFPNLIDIWSSAQRNIREADYLIVVGYSFSEADTYISKIIARSISEKENQKMLVIDPDPRLVQKLRKRFSARIDGFDNKRILQACEGCEKILPDILDSMITNDNEEVINTKEKISSAK